jgi:hypothetical protein
VREIKKCTHTVLIRNPEGNRPVPLICGMVMLNQTLKKGMGIHGIFSWL